MGDELKPKDTEEIQEVTQDNAEEPNTDKTGKTFTQAELDEIINDRLARERKKQPSKEELSAFSEWKKSQQTEAEKAAEREKALQAAEAKAMTLEREKAIILSGVKPDDVDYVMFKVGKLDGDFSDNLKAFLTENKKFTEPETKSVDGVKHSPAGGEKTSGVEEAFMRRNPGLKL